MKYLLILVSAVFLIACQEEGKDKSKITDSGSVMKSEDLDTCLCDDLKVDSSGRHFQGEELYTGVCVDYYPQTQDKYLEKNILSGQLHGKVTYYDKEGEVLLEEIFEKGNKKRSGEVDILTCDCSELELMESNMPAVPNRFLLDEIPFTGSCEKKYAGTDQIYMEANYKNGLLDGRTIYYNKDGSTILIEKYVAGELVSTVH